MYQREGVGTRPDCHVGEHVLSTVGRRCETRCGAAMGFNALARVHGRFGPALLVPPALQW